MTAATLRSDYRSREAARAAALPLSLQEIAVGLVLSSAAWKRLGDIMCCPVAEVALGGNARVLS